jgi:hypothetical protein
VVVEAGSGRPSRDPATRPSCQVVCSWYDVLLTVQDAPEVRLEQANAVGQRDGATPGLAALEEVQGLGDSAALHGARASCGDGPAPRGCPAADDAALALPLAAPSGGTWRDDVFCDRGHVAHRHGRRVLLVR